MIESVVEAGTAASPGQYDFSLLFQTERAMFSVAGSDGFFKEVNPAFERLLGRSRKEILNHSMFEFIVPEDIPATLQGISDLEGKFSEVLFENRWLHTDGTVRWLEWIAKSDLVSGLWYATARDVSESRQAQQSLLKVQQRLNLALSVANAGSWESNMAETRLHLDAGTEVLLGLAPGLYDGSMGGLLQLVHRGDRARILRLIRSLDLEESSLDTDFRLKDESMGTRHIALRGRVISRDRRQHAMQAVGIAFDITNQKALEEQLLALVMLDSLTAVRNRRSFDQALRREWSRSGKLRRPLSILMIDIDEFKLYNDTLGHQAGDETLSSVARALNDSLQRPNDLLARYGGEEFVALLPDTSVAQAAVIGERFLEAVRALRIPHPSSRHGTVTVSIGAASGTADAATKSREVLAAADAALYKAKSSGRNRLQA